LKASALPEVQKTVLFIDFDNTISQGDVLDSVIEKFSRTTQWEHWQTEWREARISTLECLQRQIGDLEVDEATLLDYVRKVSIDPDFVRLQAWAAATGTELLIVSDNFAPILDEILRHNNIVPPPVYANALAFADGHIIPSFPYRSPTCARCAHCKAVHFARYVGYRTIYVGDGLSDTCPALRADLVFAKDSLAAYLDAQGRPYIPFKNLGEVVSSLVASGGQSGVPAAAGRADAKRP
jgi:2,3-diketo-5-methylthio-1-phosphopentane phosphatase